MNLNANIVGLVLASVTGWILLVFGALPVAVLRRHRPVPLIAAGLWVVVAALAPPEVFHWYLIFAVLCLVAWTKMESLGGKIWMAAAAALGLSLGIVFPLEMRPPLLLRENPYTLGMLYLGSALTAFAIAVCVTAVRGAGDSWCPKAQARGLVITTLAWAASLAARPFLAAHFTIAPHIETLLPEPAFHALIILLFGLSFTLLLLSLFVVGALGRGASDRVRIFALLGAVLALIETLLSQFFYC